MDVPFSDIGLEIGAWLLGHSAERRVDYILTGDGGDEMWASHPVYAAQRIVHRYDRLPIPRLVNRTLQRFAAQLPDSDRKRDLRVILKRILPPEALPADLRHFRWKSYYAGGELEATGVFKPDAVARLLSRHQSRRSNDSHRLWAVVVLQLWMRNRR